MDKILHQFMQAISHYIIIPNLTIPSTSAGSSSINNSTPYYKSMNGYQNTRNLACLQRVLAKSCDTDHVTWSRASLPTCFNQSGFHPGGRPRLAGMPAAFAFSSSWAGAVLVQVPACRVKAAHHPFHLLNLTSSCTQKHHFLCSRPFCIHGDAELAGAAPWSKSKGKVPPQNKHVLVKGLGRNEAISRAVVVALDWAIEGSLLRWRDNLDIFCHGTFLCLANRELHLIALGWAETLQVFFVQKHVLPMAVHKSPALVRIEGLDGSVEHGATWERLAGRECLSLNCN